MATYLSEAWFDAVAGIAVGRTLEGSLSARIECSTSGGPAPVTAHVIVEDGVIREVGLGKCADADLSVTSSYADAVAMSDGSLEPSVAFMQGRLKTAGAPGKVLEVLALTASSEHRALRAEIAAVTEYA